MKKFTLTVVTVLVLAVASKAQTGKDWYLIGGNLGDLGLGFQKGNTTFSLSVTPRVAWFVRDDVAIGAQAKIGVATATGYTDFNYSIGPIARYYLPNRGLKDVRKTRIFLDANVGLNGNNHKASGMPAVNTNGLGIGFGPGLAYFINQNIALEVLPKYNLTVGFGNSATNNALDISFGFQIHLPKSKLNAMKNDVK